MTKQTPYIHQNLTTKDTQKNTKITKIIENKNLRISARSVQSAFHPTYLLSAFARNKIAHEYAQDEWKEIYLNVF